LVLFKILVFIGVSIFFIISGFVIAHVMQNENLTIFLKKRILRVYPPLMVSIIIILLVDYCYYDKYYAVEKILLAMSLWNYFTVDNVVIQGVAWTLVIEILFYIFMAVTYYLFRKNLLTSIIILNIILMLLMQFSKDLGPEYFLFSASLSYVPMLISGSIIYLFIKNEICFYNFILVMFTNFLIIIYCISVIQPSFLEITNSYIINYFYALSIVFIVILNESKLKEVSKYTKFFNNISYSFYLYHGFVSFLIMDLFMSKMGVFSIIFSFIISVAISFISYYYIERYFIDLARR